MLMPIFKPSSFFPVKEKNSVFTSTPRSTATALAELCHIFDRTYFIVEPKENHETNLREKVKEAAISEAVKLSPVPSWYSNVVTSISP